MNMKLRFSCAHADLVPKLNVVMHHSTSLQRVSDGMIALRKRL